MFIKALLLAGLVLVGLTVVRRRERSTYAAGKKLLLALFVVAFVVSVLEPDLTTRVAQAVGVGRGADLLLYLLVLAFVFFVLNVYVRFRDQRFRVGELARAVAVRVALEDYGSITTSTWAERQQGTD